jgi:hypothetical protein
MAPRAMLGAAVGAVVLATAACGGGSKAASQTTTTTVAAGRGAGLQAFRQCMAAHGVTLAQRPRTSSTTEGSAPPPSRTDGGGAGGFGGFGGGGGFANRFQQPPAGVDPGKYRTALQACQAQLPNPQGNAQFQSAFVAYVNCLKSHGVQVGDPSLGARALDGVDRSTATFQAAQQVCRALLPNRGQGTTTSTTG